jgi:hypothetical protein
VEGLHNYAIGHEDILVHSSSGKVPGAGAGGHGEASNIGNLTGMSRAEVDAALTARGATKHITAGDYTHYRFPDGSEVFIRPDGRVGRIAAPQYDPDTGQRTNRGQRLDQDGRPTSNHDSGDRVSD